ncbi:MAG TPA: Nif3-like dinuclear metal center hexameric protein, partial [Acetivibrio saccincola]|nr:Nif3-like dinuclear metal center hexameric protein [Acetivibrio saccincola]
MSVKLSEIIKYIENIAPKSLAEDYDNSGLIIGRKEKDIKRVMVCLDVTSKVVEEAVEKNTDLIVSHHPLIFKGLKRINYDDVKGRIIYNL